MHQWKPKSTQTRDRKKYYEAKKGTTEVLCTYMETEKGERMMYIVPCLTCITWGSDTVPCYIISVFKHVSALPLQNKSYPHRGRSGKVHL